MQRGEACAHLERRLLVVKVDEDPLRQHALRASRSAQVFLGRACKQDVRIQGWGE